MPRPKDQRAHKPHPERRSRAAAKSHKTNKVLRNASKNSSNLERLREECAKWGGSWQGA